MMRTDLEEIEIKFDEFVASQIPLDPEFNSILNEMFWDLIDNEPSKVRF